MIHAGIRGGFVAVAIAAQIGCDDAEMLAQLGLNLVPDQVRLRVAMQQQERRLAAVIADACVDGDAVGVDAVEGVIGEHGPKCTDHRAMNAAACWPGDMLFNFCCTRVRVL